MQEKDPFWEPTSTEVVVGVVTVPLNYVAHMLEFQDEPLTIIDYKAKQSGFLKVLYTVTSLEWLHKHFKIFKNLCKKQA